MNTQAHDTFTQVCDRLSSSVDAVQYERMRWARDVGPRLAELVALLLGAIEQRPDLEFFEERSSTEVKRYVLKVHGLRIVGFALWIKDGKAHIQPVEIERSRFYLASDQTFSIVLDGVNAAWISFTLVNIFALIKPHEDAPDETVSDAPPVQKAPQHSAPAVQAPKIKTLRVG